MSVRELVVLGTGSQVPTRTRNHNGCLLLWDGHGLLLDPGEGTQRQMLLAGVSASAITRICVTHFHGDHCLGLPSVVQRLSLDRVDHPVHVHYPASGQAYWERLRHASAFHETADVVPAAVAADGMAAETGFGELLALPLEHTVDCVGYRLVEPDGRRMLPEQLAAYGIVGPDVGRLERDGEIVVLGRTVTLAEVSELRPGQRFAFVMDTRLCDNVFALADRADLLVVESTFLERDASLAHAYGHLTAGQAARVARECQVRRLVLTHFSQRYTDPEEFGREAAEQFDGDIVVASDLQRVAVPKRR